MYLQIYSVRRHGAQRIEAGKPALAVCAVGSGPQSWPAYPSLGVGDDGTWPPEESLLVVDISRDDTVALGRRFAHDAVVVGTRSAPARVLDIRAAPPRAWTSAPSLATVRPTRP